MSFSKTKYEAIFGTAWHTAGKEIAQLLTFVEYAGNPTGQITPDFIGQECFDTANQAFYQACGLTAADWKKLTP